jgi:hypothetical protein
MSLATVYGTAQYAHADDATATGIYAGTISFNGTADTAEAPDHLGCVVGFAVGNPKKDVSVDGIVKTKATGLAGNIGATITLANSTHNGRTRLNEALGASISSATGATIIITGNSLGSSGTGFETGGITGIYNPFVAAGTTYTLT